MMVRRRGKCGDGAGKRTAAGASLALSAILVVSLVLFLSTAANAAYAWTSTGSPSPGSNSVRCLALDETHNILYAGADTGEVYRYQSGVWSTTGGPSAQTAINDIEYDPVSNTVVAALYANSSFQVWTYQEGSTWTLTNGTVGNDNPSSVASDGAQKKLYAATYSGAAWVYDYRQAPGPWASLGNPLNSVRCMKMDTTRHVLYAGGYTGTVWPMTAAVSRYDGSTWSSFGNTFGVGIQVSCLALDSPRNILYAGTDQGVYVTTDGAKTWQTLGANLPSAYVHDLIVHPRDNMIVIATHGRGMWALDANLVNNKDKRPAAPAKH